MKKILLIFCFLIPYFVFSQINYPAKDSLGNYGIINSFGKWVVQPKYSSIGEFFDYQYNKIDSATVFVENNYYKNSNIVISKKSGLISEKGKILIKPKYDRLICSKGLCLATDEKETWILDYQEKKLEKPKENLVYLKDSVIVFTNKENQFFYKKVFSNKIFGPFKNVSFFWDKKMLYVDYDESKQYDYNGNKVTINNEEVEEAPFEVPFKNVVWKGKSFALLDKNKKIITDFYDKIYYQNGSYLVESHQNKNKRYTVLNKKGEIVIKSYLPIIFFSSKASISYDSINKRFYLLENNKKTLIKNLSDKNIFGNFYPSFNSDLHLIYFTDTYTYSYLDKKGNIIRPAFTIKPAYTTFTNFYNHYAFALKDGKWYRINDKLEILNEINVSGVRGFDSHGNHQFTDKNGNVGLMNYLGEIIVKAEYYRITNENDFYYRVAKRDPNREGWELFYYTDSKGNYLDNNITEAQFFYAKNYFVIYKDYDYYFYDYKNNYLGSSRLGLTLDVPQNKVFEQRDNNE